MSDSDLDDAGRILMAAADIVDKRWRQRGLGEDGSPRCAAGAIEESAREFFTDEKPLIRAQAIDMMHAELSRRCEDEPIADFNDAPGRTAAEVAAVMRAAVRPKKGNA